MTKKQAKQAPVKQAPAPLNITGRDGLIEAKAWLYAIAAIQGLPSERQEWSDMSDMVRMLQAYVTPSYAAVFALGVERHVGREIDFEMVVDEDDERPEWLDEYQAQLAALKRQIAEAQQARSGDNNVIPFRPRAS